MTDFGPGTVTIGTAPLDFTCEVLGGSVTHAYEEVGQARRMMCGTEKAAKRTRSDGVTFQLETDLRESGLLAYLYTRDPDDPDPEPIAYTPHTETGASWAGTVVPLLPPDVGAGEYGAPITGTVTWPAVGHLDFTPGADPA